MNSFIIGLYIFRSVNILKIQCKTFYGQFVTTKVHVVRWGVNKFGENLLLLHIADVLPAKARLKQQL